MHHSISNPPAIFVRQRRSKKVIVVGWWWNQLPLLFVVVVMHHARLPTNMITTTIVMAATGPTTTTAATVATIRSKHSNDASSSLLLLLRKCSTTKRRIRSSSSTPPSSSLAFVRPWWPQCHDSLQHPPPATITTTSIQPQHPTKIRWMKHPSDVRTLMTTTTTRLYDASSSSSNDKNNHHHNQKNDDSQSDKFGWSQRWASIQSLILGAIVGSIASAPISLFHNLVILQRTNPMAQWEYDTDANAIIGGLFAIVYRYCIRDDGDTNPPLKQGCVSAMILIRTLPQIHIPSYCTSVPLNCHHENIITHLLSSFSSTPYLFDDGIVLQQWFWSGLESTLLFTVVAQMMDHAMTRQYIQRFPGGGGAAPLQTNNQASTDA